jgi:hypothetical protein
MGNLQLNRGAVLQKSSPMLPDHFVDCCGIILQFRPHPLHLGDLPVHVAKRGDYLLEIRHSLGRQTFGQNPTEAVMLDQYPLRRNHGLATVQNVRRTS